jgi:hypothetical protein
MAASLRCPECRNDAVLRCSPDSLAERLLTLLGISPFQCHLCSRRFWAFRWGKSHRPRQEERRAHRRIPVRFSMALSAGGFRGKGWCSTSPSAGAWSRAIRSCTWMRSATSVSFRMGKGPQWKWPPWYGPWGPRASDLNFCGAPGRISAWWNFFGPMPGERRAGLDCNPNPRPGECRPARSGHELRK